MIETNIELAKEKLNALMSDDELTLAIGDMLTYIEKYGFDDNAIAFSRVFALKYKNNIGECYKIADTVFPVNMGYEITIKHNKSYDVAYINGIKAFVYRRNKKTPDLGIVPSKQEMQAKTDNNENPYSWNTYESFEIINDEQHKNDLFKIITEKHPEINTKK